MDKLQKCYVDSKAKNIIIYIITFLLVLILYSVLYLVLYPRFYLSIPGLFIYFCFIFLLVPFITKFFFKLENENLYRLFLFNIKKYSKVIIILAISYDTLTLVYFLAGYGYLTLHFIRKYKFLERTKSKVLDKFNNFNKLVRWRSITFYISFFMILFTLFINIGVIKFILIFIATSSIIFIDFLDLLLYEKKLTDLIDFKYVGLEFENIIKSKIYYERKMFKTKDKKRIVRIKFKDVFSTYKVKINNQYYTQTSVFKEKTVNNCIYFCIDSKTRQSKKVKFIIENEDIKYKLVVLLQIKTIDKDLIISNYKIISFRKIFRLFFKDGIKEDVSNENILRILRYCYKYNYTYDINEELKLNTTHDSSWLFHNGGYGSGKSSLDLLSTLESNYTPVIISPWENNYDVDFLYLFYQKVKSCCKERRFFVNSFKQIKGPTSIIFYATVFSVSSLIHNLVGEYLNQFLIIIYNLIFQKDALIIRLKNLIESFLGYSNNLELIDLLSILSFLIITVVIYLIIQHFLPGIIVYFKDSTKIHQYYYIDRILDMIKNYNLLVIIEDVDRMSKQGIEDILRVCSCLNREYVKQTRPLGIISMDKDVLLENNKLSKKEFEELRNKVFSKEIFKEYDEKESILLYLKDCCKAAYTLLNASNTSNNKKQVEILDFLNNCNLKEKHMIGNFRDLHKMLDTLIFSNNINIDILKEEVKNVVKIPIKDTFKANKLFK